MQVFQIAYCMPFSEDMSTEYQTTCEEFLKIVKSNDPSLLNKVKIHLLLHLVDCMKEFGPSSSFNTER